jgi:hypothetical protein
MRNRQKGHAALAIFVWKIRQSEFALNRKVRLRKRLLIENSASDPKRILAVAVPAHILKVTLPEVGGAFSGCCAACLT